MNKEFIPYEQALILKEMGFDENYIACYSSDGKLYSNEVWKYKDGIKAPLYQQAFRWFREKYGYNCFVVTSIIDGRYFYFRENINDRREDSEPELTTKFDTYEEAELDCLRKLIEIVKNK